MVIKFEGFSTSMVAIITAAVVVIHTIDANKPLTRALYSSWATQLQHYTAMELHSYKAIYSYGATQIRGYIATWLYTQLQSYTVKGNFVIKGENLREVQTCYTN